MYLSRLEIDARNHQAGRDLGDVYRMHQRVMSGFPDMDGLDSARAALSVLYRLDVAARNGSALLLVQSRAEPDWSTIPADYLMPRSGSMNNPDTKSLKHLLGALQAGQVLRFRLRANPTRKIQTKSGPDGRRRHGRRVSLRSEEQQLLWLSRRAGLAGFRLVPVSPGTELAAVRVGIIEKLVGRRQSRAVTFESVLFDGLLEVTDSEAFRRALCEGIGPGKAFGCGLLSVAPHGR